jgi:hypothetical protein
MSIRDRILLHLLEHPVRSDAYAPDECTRRGVVQAVDASKAYAYTQISHLQAEGLIDARKARVRGRRNRTEVLMLTEKGARRAGGLR